MSASFFSHGGHHEDHRLRRITLCTIGVFIALWMGNAFIHQQEMEREMEAEHRRAEEHPHPTPTAGEVAHESTSVAESLYRSLQLFHFHDSHWSHHPDGWGYFARFSAGAFALGVPLVILGWLYRGGLRRSWHRTFRRDFVVVVGESRDARRLAGDLVQNGRAVVLVRTHGAPEPPLPGVTQIEGDAAKADFWQEAVRPHRACAVVLMAGDDVTNIRSSLALERALEKRQQAAPLPCHLQLADLHLKKGLVSLLPAPGIGSKIERRYFNGHEIAARLLARCYPLPLTLVEETASPEHYVIIGFGQFGQNVALKLVKMGQQVVRKHTPDGPRFEVCRPRVTVIDRCGQKAAQAFLHSHPGFTDTCELVVHEAECQGGEFLRLEFLQGLDPADRCSLIFCLGDESLVVSTILMLLDVCQDPAKDIDGIYLRAGLQNGPGELLSRRRPDLAKHIPIVTFAAHREIWTEDVVLNLALDTMAQQIHAAYMGVAMAGLDPKNPAPAAAKSWLSLSPEERESNREAADHLWAKLRTLGFQLETLPIASAAGQPASTDVDFALATAINDRLDELASSEHYRWMAWRLIHGWKFAPIRDDKAREHPDLVDYAALSEEAREKDRAIVQIIPDLIRIGRLRVQKNEPVTRHQA